MLDDHSSRGLKSPGFSDHRNKKASAAKLIKKAIKNVKVIYKEGEGLDGDWTCPQEYFNELVKGTHISESLYKSLGEYLVEYSKP